MENRAPGSSGTRFSNAKPFVYGSKEGDRPRKYTNRKKIYKKECAVKIMNIPKAPGTPAKIIKAAEEVCGENTVLAVVQDEIENSYCVTMDSEENADKLTKGVNIDSKFHECLFVFQNSVVVSFIHLPAHVSDESILNVLIEKNCKPLSQVFRHVHPGTEVADGTRYVRVQFPHGMTSLPWSMKFDTGLGTRSFRVKHDHQRQLCNYCGSPGHKYRQCPQLVCFNCDKHGHKEHECKIPPCEYCKKRLRHCFCKEKKCQYCNKETCICPCFTCDKMKEDCKCKCKECRLVTERCICRKEDSDHVIKDKKKETTLNENGVEDDQTNYEVEIADVSVESEKENGDFTDRVTEEEDMVGEKKSTKGVVCATNVEVDDVVFGATEKNDDLVFGANKNSDDLAFGANKNRVSVVFGTTEERNEMVLRTMTDGEKLDLSVGDDNMVFGAKEDSNVVFGTTCDDNIDRQCSEGLTGDESTEGIAKGQKRQRDDISRTGDSDDETVFVHKHIVKENAEEDNIVSEGMDTDTISSGENTGVDVTLETEVGLSCSGSSDVSASEFCTVEGKKRRNKMKFYPNVNNIKKDKSSQKNINNGDV